MAGILQTAGAFLGVCDGPTAWNRKGMFENRQMKHLVKCYLARIGADPKGQHPLPDIHALPALSPFDSQLPIWIELILQKEGYSSGALWAYKCAKMCLIWKRWEEAFPEGKWVIVRRSDLEIVSSCMAAPFMSAFQSREGWEGWVEHHKRRFREILALGPDRAREIWPERFLRNGDWSELASVLQWAGLKWNPKTEGEIAAFVSPDLWHHRERKEKPCPQQE
jgi:hypothetical protein